MGVYDDGPYEVGDEQYWNPDLVPVPANSYLGEQLIMLLFYELCFSVDVHVCLEKSFLFLFYFLGFPFVSLNQIHSLCSKHRLYINTWDTGASMLHIQHYLEPESAQ